MNKRRQFAIITRTRRLGHPEDLRNTDTPLTARLLAPTNEHNAPAEPLQRMTPPPRQTRLS